MLMEVHTITLDHRFKPPQVWKVIERFHGKKISKEPALKILQLRYADTNQSKIFKMETIHRRILKSNEYNTVEYGTGSPHYFESPLSSHSMSPLQSYPPNRLHSLSRNTARNILRLLVISLFAAPIGAEAAKLEDEPMIVQRLFYWQGVTRLLWILLSLLTLIVAFLSWRFPNRGENGLDDVERDESSYCMVVPTICNALNSYAK